MIIELLLLRINYTVCNDRGVMDGYSGVIWLGLAVTQLLNGAHTHLIHDFCGTLTYLGFKRTFHGFASLKNLFFTVSQ
jgi:hypothetical protein